MHYFVHKQGCDSNLVFAVPRVHSARHPGIYTLTQKRFLIRHSYLNKVKYVKTLNNDALIMTTIMRPTI